MKIPNRYRSLAVLEVTGGVEEIQLNAALQRSHAPERLRLLIDKHGLYSQTRATEQMPALLTKITHDINMSGVSKLPGERKAFSISFEYDEPNAAQRVLTELTQTVLEEHARANGGIRVQLSILDGPSLPRTHYYPHRPNIALAGLLTGALIGAVYAALQLRRESKFV